MFKSLEGLRLLSVNEVAQILGVSNKAVYRLVYAGRLQPIRLSERRVRFTEEAVLKLLNESVAKSA